MSELQELYEKLTKAREVCYGTTEKGNPCKGCPYEIMECDSKSENDMYKLIELQHAEIERLRNEHKMALYDKVITAQGFCDRKDCKNCPCYERKRCTYLEEVRLLIDEQHTELQRLKGESNNEEEGSV